MWPCPNRLVSGNFCTVKTRNKIPEEGHRQAGALLDFMRPIRDHASERTLSVRSIDYASDRCFMRPIKLYASNQKITRGAMALIENCTCFRRYHTNKKFSVSYSRRNALAISSLKVCILFIYFAFLCKQRMIE